MKQMKTLIRQGHVDLHAVVNNCPVAFLWKGGGVGAQCAAVIIFSQLLEKKKIYYQTFLQQ